MNAGGGNESSPHLHSEPSAYLPALERGGGRKKKAEGEKYIRKEAKENEII